MTSVAFQGNAVSFGARRSTPAEAQPTISLDGASDQVSFSGTRSKSSNANSSNSVLGCIAGCCGIPIVLGLLACVGLRLAFRGKGAPAA